MFAEAGSMLHRTLSTGPVLTLVSEHIHYCCKGKTKGANAVETNCRDLPGSALWHTEQSHLAFSAVNRADSSACTSQLRLWMASADPGAVDGGVTPAVASPTSGEATIPGTEATLPADGWYYLLDGQHLGPFTTEQLIGATRYSREDLGFSMALPGPSSARFACHP